MAQHTTCPECGDSNLETEPTPPQEGTQVKEPFSDDARRSRKRAVRERCHPAPVSSGMCVPKESASRNVQPTRSSARLCYYTRERLAIPHFRMGLVDSRSGAPVNPCSFPCLHYRHGPFHAELVVAQSQHLIKKPSSAATGSDLSRRWESHHARSVALRPPHARRKIAADAATLMLDL